MVLWHPVTHAQGGSIFDAVDPLKDQGIESVVNNILKFMRDIGIALVTIFIIYGGITWMTSAGDPGKIKAGRETLQWSLIGLAVILMASGITSAVLEALKVKNNPVDQPLPQQQNQNDNTKGNFDNTDTKQVVADNTDDGNDKPPCDLNQKQKQTAFLLYAADSNKKGFPCLLSTYRAYMAKACVEEQYAKYGEGKTNATTLSKKYGNPDGGAWCAAFVSYCYGKAGIPWPVNTTYGKIYVPDVWNNWGGTKFTPEDIATGKTKPQTGDLVIYKDNGSPPYAHIGMITDYNSKTGVFYTLEGNASSNDSNAPGAVITRRSFRYDQVHTGTGSGDRHNLFLRP